MSSDAADNEIRFLRKELAVMKALELVCEAIPGYVPVKQPLAAAPPS